MVDAALGKPLAGWILHASHNLFIQSILTPLTRNTGSTNYIIDEFGIGLVVTIAIGAIVVWRKRRELPNAALDN